MVFENLTLVELHVDDAQIGPSAVGDRGGRTVASEGGSGGGRRLGLALAGLVLVAGAAAAALRLRGRDGDGGGRITIEQSAEQ